MLLVSFAFRAIWLMLLLIVLMPLTRGARPFKSICTTCLVRVILRIYSLVVISSDCALSSIFVHSSGSKIISFHLICLVLLKYKFLLFVIFYGKNVPHFYETWFRGWGSLNRLTRGICDPAVRKWPSIRLLSLLANPTKTKSIRILKNHVLLSLFHIPWLFTSNDYHCSAHLSRFSIPVLFTLELMSVNYWRSCKHRQISKTACLTLNGICDMLSVKANANAENIAGTFEILSGWCRFTEKQHLPHSVLECS